MIVPMKKVLLLTQESDARQALEELRNAGVMQISSTGNVSADAANLAEKRNQAERLLAELEKYESSDSSSVRIPGGELLKKSSRRT